MPDPFAKPKHALSDRYEVERVPGHGAMATAYLAEDLQHHHQVAINVIRPGRAYAPETFAASVTRCGTL